MDIEYLRQRLIDINEESQNVVQAALADDRDLTEEENDKLEALDTEYKKTDRQIRNIERVQDQAVALTKGTGRKTEPDDQVLNMDTPNTGSRSHIEFLETPAQKRNNGFKSFGEFAKSVKNFAIPGGGGTPDQRLFRNAPTTISTEGTGADGGFAVPPDYRTEITQMIMGEDSLLGRTDNFKTSSNTLVIPADETTPWQSTGGIQVYWESEAGQKSQSKVALKEKTVRLNKLIALCPVTDELLADAATLDSYLRKKVTEKMNFAVSLAIVQGTGVGEPLGILNCGSKVTVSKESGQSADTIVFENITNMWSRMYGPWRKNGIWLVNQDIEPQLLTMSFEGTSSSVPAYMPANGLSASPYATLMGRPVIPTQACETLGDAGDIIFTDLKQYLSVVKTTGVKEDLSIHLWFDYDVTAYRFVFRVGGQCWWAADIDPRDGSTAMGANIIIEART